MKNILLLFFGLVLLCSCSSSDSNEEEESSMETYSAELLNRESTSTLPINYFYDQEIVDYFKPSITTKDTTYIYGYGVTERDEKVKLSIIGSKASLVIDGTITDEKEYHDAEIYNLTFSAKNYNNGIEVKSDGIYKDGSKSLGLNNFTLKMNKAKGDPEIKKENSEEKFSGTGTIPDGKSTFVITNGKYSFQCSFVGDGITIKQLEPENRVIGMLDKEI
jgi:hypothetical protein